MLPAITEVKKAIDIETTSRFAAMTSSLSIGRAISKRKDATGVRRASNEAYTANIPSDEGA
jgi:hypothetical protein